jgi:hypothetical protein
MLAMHSRTLRIFMLLAVTLWFGVVVPGHERGRVRVPGAAPQAPCHAAAGRGHCHAPTDTDAPAKAPSDNDASHCAVCRFVATLSCPAPPPPLPTVARVGLVSADHPAVAPSTDDASPFLRRGPPQPA